jgi:hypothetical protein
MGRKLFFQVASILPCLICDLVEWIRDLIVIKLLRRHQKILHDSGGEPSPFQDARRIAVIAIRPTIYSEPFTLNLLRALVKNDFHILLVCNGMLSDRQREVFLSFSKRIIERPPTGRDFGCYQTGLNLLGLSGTGLPERCERLLLANDSMFYRADTAELIADMLRLDGSWVTMFESYEKAFHAQSFFLIFSPQAFRSFAFRKFWKNYKPYSSRPHTIKKGEIGFSRALKRSGLVPQPYYSSTRIRQVVEAAELGPSELLNLLPSTSIISWNTWAKDILDLAQHQIPIEGQNPTLKFLSQNLLRKLSRTTESSNPTHAAGLLLNYLADAPLKRDICYRDTHSIADIMKNATGFDAREMQMMEYDLRIRGVFASLSSLEKLLYARGRI